MRKPFAKCVRPLVLAGFLLFPFAVKTVTFEWTPSADAYKPGKISHYKIYFSPVDFTVPPTNGLPPVVPIGIDVGLDATATLTNLPPGLTYFAVVTVDSEGTESDYSNVASITIPFTSGGGGDPGSGDPTNSIPTQLNMLGMLPRLWLYSTNGQALIAVSGAIGATCIIQSSTNPAIVDSWMAVTNLKLAVVAPNVNPTGTTTLEKAFVPALETFQDPNPTDGVFRFYRIYMPLGYAIAANKALALQDISSRLIAVCYPDGSAHIVCYVTPEVAYLDYDDTTHIARLAQSGPTIREIANAVATSLGKTNWISACEFTVADNGTKKLFAYVLRTADPLTDPPLGVPTNLDILLNF